MLEKSDKTRINNLFKSMNKGEEFEVMFNNYKADNKLSVINFMKIIKFAKWRSDNYNLPLIKEDSLDICYNFEKFI